MRIAIISDLTNWSWAGCEELWAALAYRALESGHKVSVFLCRQNIPHHQIQPLIDMGLELHLPGAGAALVERTRRLSWRLGNAIAPSFPLFQALEGFSPNVVLISAGDALPSPAFLSQLKRSNALRWPYVLVCHNSHLFQRPIEGAAGDAAARYYLGARRVFFVAERTRMETQHLLAVKLPQSRIVRNPVNMKDIGVLPMPATSTFGIACLGRLAIQSKGQDTLLAALGGPNLKGRNWHLSIYGEGPDANHLLLLARHYGISDRVAMKGYANDVRAIWAENHLLALPSRVESAPLAIVEAMLCGRPSVVNDIGGTTEWITEPETGFVSAGLNIASFEAALERAWDARSEWTSIGMRASEKARKLMDTDPGGTLLNLMA
jgi:glycosyltransferase involved in cell wall biosynthesis